MIMKEEVYAHRSQEMGDTPYRAGHMETVPSDRRQKGEERERGADHSFTEKEGARHGSTLNSLGFDSLNNLGRLWATGAVPSCPMNLALWGKGNTDLCGRV